MKRKQGKSADGDKEKKSKKPRPVNSEHKQEPGTTSPSLETARPIQHMPFRDHPFETKVGHKPLLEVLEDLAWDDDAYDTYQYPWPVQPYAPSGNPPTAESVGKLFRAAELILNNWSSHHTDDVDQYIAPIIQRLDEVRVLQQRAASPLEASAPRALSDIQMESLVKMDMTNGFHASLCKIPDIRHSPVLQLWRYFLLARRGSTPNGLTSNTSFCALRCVMHVLPCHTHKRADPDVTLEFIKMAMRCSPECKGGDHDHFRIFEYLYETQAAPIAMLVACRTRLHMEQPYVACNYTFCEWMNKVNAASDVVLSVNPQITDEKMFQVWVSHIGARDLAEYFLPFGAIDCSTYAAARFDAPPPSLDPYPTLDACESGWSFGRDSVTAFEEMCRSIEWVQVRPDTAHGRVKTGTAEDLGNFLFPATAETKAKKPTVLVVEAGVANLPRVQGLYQVNDCHFYLKQCKRSWLVVSLPVKFDNMHSVAHERYRDRRRTIWHNLDELKARLEEPTTEGEVAGSHDMFVAKRGEGLKDSIESAQLTPILKDVKYQEVYSVQLCIIDMTGNIATRPDFMSCWLKPSGNPSKYVRPKSVQLLKTVDGTTKDVDTVAATVEDLYVCGFDMNDVIALGTELREKCRNTETLGWTGPHLRVGTARFSTRSLTRSGPTRAVELAGESLGVIEDRDAKLVQDARAPGGIMAENTFRAHAANVVSHTTRAIYAARLSRQSLAKYPWRLPRVADWNGFVDRYLNTQEQTVLPDTRAIALSPYGATTQNTHKEHAKLLFMRE